MKERDPKQDYLRGKARGALDKRGNEKDKTQTELTKHMSSELEKILHEKKMTKTTYYNDKTKQNTSE